MGTTTQKKHIHEGNAFNNDIIAVAIAPLLMGIFFYGLRVVVIVAVAVITAMITDRLCAMLRGIRYDQTENSSIAAAVVLVLLLPASVPYVVVVVGVVAAVLVGKQVFGGYMNHPFNPAAVGYCVAAVSWPEQMFRYPVPQDWLFNRALSLEQLIEIWQLKNVPLSEGASALMRAGGLPKASLWDMLLGSIAGPLGATAATVLLGCWLVLYVRKRAPFIPGFFFLATIAVVAFFFPRVPEGAWQVLPWVNPLQRLQTVGYELLSGGTAVAAVFLICEPATLPKTNISRMVYGIVLGLMSLLFRYFGTYDIGICFAFLLVNAVSGYFDRVLATGTVKKKGGAKA